MIGLAAGLHEGAVSVARPEAQPQGALGALGDFYDRFGSTAYSLALSITNDAGAAERIVTAAFASAWRTYARGSESSTSFFTTLMTEVRSKAMSCTSVASRRGSVDRPDLRPGDPRFPVVAVLRDLPAAQQHVLSLAYFAGLGVRDIAAELQQPVSYVKENLQAALARLHSALAVLDPRGATP